MDEILIEDKKYVSSKQAAKMTGYAKDYIGQLCREGRVPARLVGRSWYVLESAIQDHRFGNPIEVKETKNIKNKIEVPALESTWDSPRYEASPAPILPSINRLRGTAVESIEEERRNEQLDQPSTTEEQEGKVNIPIHAVYTPLPEKFLSPTANNVSQDPVIEGEEEPILKEISQQGRRGSLMRTVQMLLIVPGIIALGIMAINTGYLDKYIAFSNQQVMFISGVSIYNK